MTEPKSSSLIDSDATDITSNLRPTSLTDGEMGSMADIINPANFLLDMGMVPRVSGDDLMTFALAQTGVRRAQVALDVKDDSRVVTYQVQPRSWIKYRLFRWLSAKRSIISKIGILLLARFGAPVSAEAYIIRLATEYLPKGYHVKVQFFKNLPPVPSDQAS